MVRSKYRVSKLETQIEEDAAARVLAWFAVFSIKLKKTNETGYPDRLYLLPGGSPLFVEYKRPGEEPRKKQALIHQRLAHFGYAVETHTSVEETMKSIAERLPDE